MKDLMDNWEYFKSLLNDSIFLMSDYDGTLTPIVKRPEDAELSEKTRDLLIQLKESCPIAIISGRALGDLKNRVGVDGIYYSGNHGFEISGPDVDFEKKEAKVARSAIQEVSARIEEKISSIDGTLVESKGFTSSIHYRLVKEDLVSRIKEVVEEEVAPFLNEDLIEIGQGKKVLEIRPKIDWNKGDAVSVILGVTGLEGEALPIYLGDDVTDEDAFNYVRREGIGVLVSEENRSTAANFRLRGVGEVEDFLAKLCGFLKEGEKEKYSKF